MDTEENCLAVSSKRVKRFEGNWINFAELVANDSRMLCLLLGLRRRARARKCKPLFVAKMGVMVPGVPCVDRGNCGRELALCECSVLRRMFWQESRLVRWCHLQRCRSFSERVGPRIVVLESQPGKQSSRSKRSRHITTEAIAVWVQTTCTKTLTKKQAVNDGM